MMSFVHKKMMYIPFLFLFLKDDILSEVETAELHDITVDIHFLSPLRTSICWQQSRLGKGDANSKF